MSNSHNGHDASEEVAHETYADQDNGGLNKTVATGGGRCPQIFSKDSRWPLPAVQVHRSRHL